jgi:ferredoxin-NADP reductase
VPPTLAPAPPPAPARPGRLARRLLGSSLLDALTTPHGVDRYVELVRPAFSLHEVRAEVVAVRRPTPRSVTLTLRPNANWTGFRAGQFVRASVEIDGVRHTRCYSPASSAHACDRLELTAHAQPDGAVSPFLRASAKPGMVVSLSPAEGDFALPDARPRALLLISGGSGITPVMSMLRTLARRQQIGDIVHVHSAPTESDVMFGSELLELANAHDAYRLRLRATRTEGRLDLSRLDDEVPDWRDRQTWACGPEGMLNQAEKTWSAAGVTERLHLERFALSRVPVHGQGGMVEFARSGKTVTVDAATPLMDAGESVGVRMPFGCRMGICQSCVVELVDGHVRDLRSGVEREPGNRIQTCISAASGDCVLDV